jgi:hypothetical protein
MGSALTSEDGALLELPCTSPQPPPGSQASRRRHNTVCRPHNAARAPAAPALTGNIVAAVRDWLHSAATMLSWNDAHALLR